MSESIIVNNIFKKFKISRKQQAIEKTNLKYKEALKGISFNVNQGEIFGLLGPNGAGKTTALRCISSLMTPDKGEITINGISVKDDIEVKKILSFLTSELKLEDTFTPNYLYDYFSELYGIKEEERNARKKELFSIFGIQKYAEVKIGELSTGMKQKVSIAISLVHDPEIIIFDEPTNGLDVLTAKTVVDYLLSLKEKGKTIILSTHIMELVDKICDRVAIIINGKVVACATKQELCKDKSLEQVFFDLYKNEVGEDNE